MRRALWPLYLPCEALAVRAIVSLADGITPLEQMVLEVVWRADGRLRLDDLLSMFGLGHRPTLDLVQGLWNTGSLAIDMQTGALHVTEGTRQLIETGALDQMDSVARAEVPLRVMRELVTGHIVPFERGAGEFRRGLAIPALLDPSNGNLSDHESAELFDLARVLVRGTPMLRSITADTSRSRGYVVRDVVPVGRMGAGSRYEFIHVRTHVEMYETEGLLFDVVKPIGLADHVRRALSERLETLAREMPKLDVFRNLAGRLMETRGEERPHAVDRALALLNEACAEVGAAPQPEAMSRHQECEIAARNFLALLRDEAAHSAAVSVLSGTDAFTGAVGDAIRQAREQLVLVCPFVDASGGDRLAYERYTSDLIQAMRSHGVKLVVLWGIQHGQTIDSRFANWLALLQAEAKNGIVVRAVDSAQLHAKAVIADGRLAVVGSVNFLNKRARDGVELGLRVESADGAPSTIVTDLLRWARHAAPTSVVSSMIAIPGVSRASGADHRLPLPRAPRTTSMTGRPEEAALAISVCQEEWKRFAAEARLLAGQQRSVCRLVEDGDNRTLLLRALRTARLRLLISSDQLSEEAVDPTVLRMLAGRLREGVPVAIIWRGRPDRDQSIEAQLRRLDAEYPRTLTLVRANNHSKDVAWDDEVLVSSFNFLSFGGDYETARGARGPLELGIHVNTADTAESVSNAMAAQLDGALDGWVLACSERRMAHATPISEGEAPAPADTSVGSPAGGGLQELIHQLAEADDSEGVRAGIIRRFFERVQAPITAVEVLVGSGLVRPREARIATLHALRRAEARTHPLYTSLILPIAAEAWVGGRYFEAAALLTELEDVRSNDASLPPLRVAYLAAVSGDQQAFGNRLAEILTDPAVTIAERDSAMLLTTVALARQGWYDVGQMIITEADDAVAGIGGRILKAYIEGWWTRMGGAPFPIEMLKRLVLLQSAVSNQEVYRRALDEACEHALRQQYPSFEPGERTLRTIFAKDGPLGKLRSAIERGDVAETRRVLHDAGLRDDIIDGVWAKLDGRPRKPLGKPFRPSITRLTDAALRAARGWLDASGDDAPAPMLEEIAALTTLHGLAAPLMPDLRLAQGIGVVTPIARACCELFEPLVGWQPPPPTGYRA